MNLEKLIKENWDERFSPDELNEFIDEIKKSIKDPSRCTIVPTYFDEPDNKKRIHLMLSFCIDY